MSVCVDQHDLQQWLQRERRVLQRRWQGIESGSKRVRRVAVELKYLCCSRIMHYA